MSDSVEQVIAGSPSDTVPVLRALPGRQFGMVLALVACGAAVAGAVAGSMATVAVTGRPSISVATAAPFIAGATGSQPTSRVGAVAAAMLPTVVAIRVASHDETDVGAGVVVRSDGMVLTADHLVAHDGTITITLADGRTSTAHVIGRAARRDLAVVQADKLRQLTPATFGSAQDVRVGDGVLVIGNPLGFADTVTSGIVSAVHRSIPVGGEQPRLDPLFGTPTWPKPTAFINDAIQTDAAINPGNSGGPLVDLRSHVIGIITTVVSTAANDPDAGCAFAIPSDLAWSTAKQLMSSRS